MIQTRIAWAFRKTIFLLLIILCIGNISAVDAEPVAKISYVYLNYSGEYTGQADSNGIPFGFGVFISKTPVEGELWHYIGYWQDGLPEGEGAIYFENGNMQKGTFLKGELAEGLSYTVNGLSAVSVRAEQNTPESEAAYIGNKKSMRFHYPECRAVQTMKESNKVEFSSREEAIKRNYIPCGECNP